VLSPFHAVEHTRGIAVVRNQGRYGTEETRALGRCCEERDASVGAGFRFVEQAHDRFVESPFEERDADCPIAHAGAASAGWLIFTPFQSAGSVAPRPNPGEFQG
jgi:hypothetical protein